MKRHHTGKSLRPGGKFKFKHSSIPMRAPSRAKKHTGRRGGLRG